MSDFQELETSSNIASGPREIEDAEYRSPEEIKGDFENALKQSGGMMLFEDNTPWKGSLSEPVQTAMFDDKAVSSFPRLIGDGIDYFSDDEWHLDDDDSMRGKGFIIGSEERRNRKLIVPIKRKGNLGNLGKQVRPWFRGWHVVSLEDERGQEILRHVKAGDVLGSVRAIDESVTQRDIRNSNRFNRSFQSTGSSQGAKLDSIVMDNATVTFGIEASGNNPKLVYNTEVKKDK